MPERYGLRLLGHVIAIAEEGSISGAARRLRLSQPTLSRQLRDLERRLGFELFVRSGRGLTPTAAGRALVQRAGRVLTEAEAAFDDARRAARGRAGRLTVAFAGSGINGPLGRALGRFRSRLPDVDLRLVEVFDDVEMSSGVLDGDFDVAVQRLPVHDARLDSRTLTREPLTLYLPAAHPLAAARGPAPLSALGDIPLVMWPREASPRAYDEIIALCHQAGVVPRIGAHGRTVQTLLALVAAGFGAAVMADSYRVLRRDGVIPRRLAGTVTSLHLVWRADDPNPLLPQFWSVLNDALARPPRNEDR
ncbi:LysR family transcriptional regulator [Thermomonospora cellulosilytica]|uniref:DNA-binding transcriptional LysR family regulator n=1 Tax=Thermomonospora cellulosilytica TaxID=1411118 RepID=A0A7W3N0H8_9ACTN|nr:LysR family transcriptional regulator [Thermomonospora cellulosilytica]MBA9005283.1 DNA-binding transcriptional LysR family regulator [Thermomonospora cellulosilytica]